VYLLCVWFVLMYIKTLGYIKTMAMESLSSLMAGVQDELEGYLTGVLVQVGRDYNLDSQELVNRYIVPCRPMSPVSIQVVQSLPVVPRVKKVPAPPGVDGKKRGRRAGPGLDSLDLTGSLDAAALAKVSLPVLRQVCGHFHLKIGGNRDQVVARIVDGSQVQPQAQAQPQETPQVDVRPWALAPPLSPVVLRSPMSPCSPVSPMSPCVSSAPPPPSQVEQDKLRRSLQEVLDDTHTDSEDEEPRWGDVGYGDEQDEELVEEDYL